MRITRIGLVAVLFTAILASSPNVSVAEEVGLDNPAIRAQAEKYRAAAERHVRRNNISGAIQSFQKMLALHRRGQTDVDVLYNLGILSESKGQCKAVVLYFQAYLRATMGEDGREEIQKKLEKCLRRVGPVEKVTINTIPPRAAVRVNDVFLGYAPIRNLSLPLQSIRVRAEKADYITSKIRHTVQSKQSNALALTLEKKVYYGNLQVLVKPAKDVTVFLNKVKVGSPPYKRERLPEGRYLLHLERPGWDNWIRYITISRNSTLTVNATMEDTDTPVAIPPLPSND